MRDSDNSRIAKNTALLYLRMLIVMAINLWTVRLVLKALGVVDYGIYDVVAGIVAMIHSISTVLSSSAQRYYSFYIGKNSSEYIKKVYTACVNIFIFLSFISVLIGELLGVWLINTQLEIPHDRIVAAHIVFQFSLFSLVFMLLQVPFSAVVIAKEDMNIFAFISVIECILKYLLALGLTMISFDRLILYGFGMMSVSLLGFLFYIWIVVRQYKEFKYLRTSVDSKLYKEILSFSGWIFSASIAGLSMNQLSTILVNMFFGPVVNAARAISFQFNNIINSFCSSFLLAIKPPMIKAYAQDDFHYLNTVFSISNKFLFYCMLMICLPLYLEMELLLSLWLDHSDPQTVLFSRLVLVYVLIMSLNNPISIIIHATGHVKEYHLLVEIPILLCAPLTYILFKLGAPAYSTYVVLILAVTISHVLRIISLKRWYESFDIRGYFKSFLIPAFFITLFVVPIVYFINQSISNIFIRVSSTIVLTLLMVGILSFYLGTSQAEKTFFRSLMTKFANKFFKIQKI